MAVPIKITVENPDELLNAGLFGAGALIQVQSSATEAGAYADLAGTGSTPTIPIVTLVRAYTAYDPAGTFSTWYRVRYKSADGTRVSVDWAGDAAWATRPGHAPFQVAGEAGGLICSLYDVKQRLGFTDTVRDEDLLEIIRQVTGEIQGYCQTQFVRTPASGTATFLLDVDVAGDTIWLPQGFAELTLLEYSAASQPGVGGAYTALAATDWNARPAQRAFGEPITSIVLSPVGALPRFYAGRNVVRATGASGYPRVPAEIDGIGQSASVRRWQARKAGGADLVSTGPDGRTMVLRSISPAEMATLDRFRVPSIG